MTMPTAVPTRDRRTPLRVGLLLDSFEVPLWVEGIVRQMVDADWIDLAAVVRNTTPVPTRSLGQRLASARKNFFYALYTRYDALRNRTLADRDPFRPTALSSLLDGVEILEVTPRLTKFSDFVEGDDLDLVRKANLDILVRFGFRILRGEMLRVPRYGIWSFHHGDERVNRGSMPGFWEVVEGAPTTGSMLQVLSEQLDAGKVLGRYVGATEPLSVVRNQRNLYRKTAPMMVDRMRQLYRNGENGLYEEKQELGAYCHPMRTAPKNREMARAIPRIVSRFVRSKTCHIRGFDQWFVAYRVRKKASDPNRAFYQFNHMLPPRDRFWADPFAVRRDGHYGVFIEEFLFEKNKAHISFFEICDDGSRSEPRVVLDVPYHLSYPHLFEFDGELFMVPESQENRTIELWRCTRYPDQWSLEKVLMDGLIAADSTLFQRNGRWWLFTATTEEGLHNRDRLELFHADVPTGPWRPHPMNPIKRDVRSARPAGNLFEDRGRLLRPAQDCAERYGAAIALNEITGWSEDTYTERVIDRITPSWRPDLLAVHTLNTVEDLTIIDGEVLRPRWGKDRA